MTEVYRIGKLAEAVRLVQKPASEDELKDYNEKLSKGLGLFNQLCLSTSLTPDDKLEVITVFLKQVPDEGQDMLSRWRDMIPYLQGKELEDLLNLLVKITHNQDIDSHQRLVTAVTLYNNCFLHICYDCFADIACDKTVLVKYRVDAARYLFASQSDEHRQSSQEALLEVVDTDTYPSDYRYEVIAGFISRTGISSMMNMTKLRVPYDEEFVYGLQTNFFYNDANGIRERILSGQHMLQMDCTDEEERTEIGTTLLEFAKNAELTENTRADAADVVLRLGTGDQKAESRQIIVDLGFSSVDGRIIGTGSLLDRAKTIYNDSQNIHEFTEQVDRFIEKIISETSITVRPYHEVHQEVTEKVRVQITDKAERFRAFKALNRISVDTAKFTKYKATLAEIFVHVWIRVQGYKDEQRSELEKRMVEELIDMGETCSSGHSGRFINVLATYDDTLRISWDEQIKGNMAGRMNARIRDCPDADLRASLAMAQSELADDEDKQAYVKFIQENLEEMKEELRKEFVDEGYTTHAEFERAFEAGTVNWI